MSSEIVRRYKNNHSDIFNIVWKIKLVAA
jgi:hypothetical protein